MAEVQLVIVEGANAGREFDLSGAIVVGRDDSAGVVIDDAESSRRHASFAVDGTQVTVEDLGSTNGTFVNEERLTAARTVGEGDRVRIGTTVLEIRAAAGQATQVRSAIPDDAVPEPQAATPPPAFPPPPDPAPQPGPPPSGFPPPPGAGAAPAPYGQQAMATQDYPIDLEADYPDGGISRWRCFFQGFLLIPHFFVLWFVAVGAYFALIFSWFAILFTRRYPPGAFNFISGALGWGTRVTFFAYLMTERYPPFSTSDAPDYPARLRIAYPEGGISRWRCFFQWLLAIPHLIVLWFAGIAVLFAIIYAWFAILFTRRYPPGVFEFVSGVLRWSTRVNAYNLLMTERYPPFSLR